MNTVIHQMNKKKDIKPQPITICDSCQIRRRGVIRVRHTTIRRRRRRSVTRSNASCFDNSRIRGVGRPRNAFDDMFVAAQLKVTTLQVVVRREERRRYLPHEYRLVIRARRHKRAVREYAHLSDPVAVANERAYAVARAHLPYFDGAIARAAHYMIATGRERHRRHIVVVALQCLDACVRLLKVPQADGHVCRTRAQQFALRVECDVLHEVGVAFEQ